MFFEFWKPSSKADSLQNTFDAKIVPAELATLENNTSAQASSAERKAAEKPGAVEKASSLAKTKESESRKDRLKKQSNSKVECRNPECTESALCTYDSAFDEDRDETVSYLHCLNCGLNFPYFEKFEKAEKKLKDEPNWSIGFAFLVAMLFTVIMIKGEQEGQFFNQNAPSVNNQQEFLRSPPSETQEQYPVRVLNGAEPFVVNDNT